MENYSSMADLKLESKKLMILVNLLCANLSFRAYLSFKAVKCDTSVKLQSSAHVKRFAPAQENPRYAPVLYAGALVSRTACTISTLFHLFH